MRGCHSMSATRDPHRFLATLGMTLLLAACASKPVMPPKPVTVLPSAALDMLCARLHAEGMTSEVRIVKETQAIVTPASLSALAEASFSTASVKPDAIQAIINTPLVPIEQPAQSCFARFVTPAEAKRATDVMLVQFSSPFPNPFARGQMGSLVRLSLGGEASIWYWIPLLNRDDRWLAGPPVTLSVIE